MSAPEPVASVRSIDIVASAFRLGTPKSLANGVAQCVELADHQQRVGADALAQHRAAAHAALRRRDLDQVAVGDAELRRRASR